MAFAIQMRPDVTLETAGEDSRGFWTKRARIAVANEMCGSIPVATVFNVNRNERLLAVSYRTTGSRV